MATETSRSRTAAVFIARAQPFHNAHYSILKHALSKYDHIIFGIGSARQARSPRNPLAAAERIEIIQRTLTADELSRITFIRLRDYLYNDDHWMVEVQQKVSTVADSLGIDQINIVGRIKDKNSSYMRLFPQWPCDEYGFQHPFDATKIREALFEKTEFAHFVPKPVVGYLEEWKKTEEYAWVLEEYMHYKQYRADHEVGPHPPIYSTTDAVVFQSGHVLLVRRKFAPGRGLLALPGGFLKADERIIDSMLSELKEETNIAIPRDILKERIRDWHVFDHPDRSLRGRTISNAYCLRLRRGKLVEVKGDDDASEALWLPLADLYEIEENTFEDHFHIIHHFSSIDHGRD